MDFKSIRMLCDVFIGSLMDLRMSVHVIEYINGQLHQRYWILLTVNQRSHLRGD